MNTFFISLFLIIAFNNCCFCIPTFNLEREWVRYKEQHDLEFDMQEDEYRKALFNENMEFIIKHNKKNLGYTLGMNRFGHMSQEEILLFTNTHKVEETRNNFNITIQERSKERDITDRDWREAEAVNPPRNQGSCDASYTFAATGVAEGAYKLKYGDLYKLSEQELVDCTFGGRYRNFGCNGGSTYRAIMFGYYFGFMSEDNYPYTAKLEKCKHDQKKVIVRVKDVFQTKPGDEKVLAEVISNTAPVGVSLDATDKTFVFYQGGIYDNPSCGKKSTYDMLAVGVMTTPVEYYIVKSSWGTSWGEDGYMRIVRNKNNMCGIANQPVYITVR